MTNLREIIYHETFVFDPKDSSTQKLNLKLFLGFLKYYDSENAGQFSFSDNKSSFHQNLTFKDNLHLDVMPMSFQSNQEQELKNFIAQIKNPYIHKMIEIIYNFNQIASKATKAEQQLFSIMKALLADKKYICLLSPDNNLKQSEIKLVQKAIEFESNENKKSILIASQNKLLWFELATKFICMQGNNYHIKERKKSKEVSTVKNLELIDQAA